jgi:hypothetical protein
VWRVGCRELRRTFLKPVYEVSDATVGAILYNEQSEENG